MHPPLLPVAETVGREVTAAVSKLLWLCVGGDIRRVLEANENAVIPKYGKCCCVFWTAIQMVITVYSDVYSDGHNCVLRCVVIAVVVAFMVIVIAAIVVAVVEIPCRLQH
eukprot:GHVS01067323.1.p3 GENE.GHVS01067323.1~~GHVS01067323.1.p3  ORF type:complete len:110 (+),score=22.22 GHVS01067323.1:214-543(+)